MSLSISHSIYPAVTLPQANSVGGYSLPNFTDTEEWPSHKSGSGFTLETYPTLATSASVNETHKDIIALKDKAGHIHALCDQLARAGQTAIAQKLTTELTKIWKTFEETIGDGGSLESIVTSTGNALNELSTRINTVITDTTSNFIVKDLVENKTSVEVATGKIIQLGVVSEPHYYDTNDPSKYVNVNKLQLTLYTKISVASNTNNLTNIELTTNSNNNLPETTAVTFSKDITSYTANVTYPNQTYYTSDYVTTSSSTLTTSDTKTNNKTVTYTINTRSFNRPFTVITDGTESAGGPSGAQTAQSTTTATYKAQVVGFSSTAFETVPTQNDWSGTVVTSSETNSSPVYITNVFQSPSISASTFVVTAKDGSQNVVENSYIWFALPKSFVTAKGITSDNISSKFILNNAGLPGGVLWTGVTFTKYDTGLKYWAFKISDKQANGKIIVSVV